MIEYLKNINIGKRFLDVFGDEIDIGEICMFYDDQWLEFIVMNTDLY